MVDRVNELNGSTFPNLFLHIFYIHIYLQSLCITSSHLHADE